MPNKLDKSEILQIFGLILAIGKSEHYSISMDYDTEFDSVDVYLWYSETQKDIDFADKLNDKQHTYAEIIEKLKSWTEIVVRDRGEMNDSPH